jgi:glucose uptake protein
MFVIDNYILAVAFCFITMLCWGSWANTQKLSSEKWPFQLFYWDYTFGIFLITLLFAFTLGSNGDVGRDFLTDLSQADRHYLESAFIGGVIFNFANLLLVIGIEIAGMAIAFPIGIGIALVLGVFTNYIALPEGNPYVLMMGVSLVAIAIIIDGIAYKKILQNSNESPFKGILISATAGIAMGFFYKFVATSMAVDFVTPEAGKLTPYTALVIFSIGIIASNFLFNTLNMYFPVSGEKVNFKDYFKMGSPKLHRIGLLGGIIWGIGMSLNILASEQAGPAIAYGLGQGATLVAAIWGVFIWKEFKGLPPKNSWLIPLMFILFVLGIILIITAKLV